MASNVKGTLFVYLQENDINIPVTIFCSICTTAYANDGYIPYGTTVSGISHELHDLDNVNDVTTDITYSNPTIGTVYTGPSGKSGQDLTIELKYPTTYGDDSYNLKYTLTLSNGSKKELNYDRIKAETN